MVLFVAECMWLLVFGVSPTILVKITPRSMRANGLWGLDGLPVLGVMLGMPVFGAFLIGTGLANPSDSPAAAGLITAVVLGGPAAAVSWRSWRTQRLIVRTDGRVPDVGLGQRWPLASEARRPTPVPAAPNVDHARHVTDRTLRRVRTVALLIALVSWRAGVASNEGTSGQPTFHLAPLLVSLLTAGLATLGLAVRRRQAGAGAPSLQALALTHRWRLVKDADDSLARAYPWLPLLRPMGHDPARTKTVLWGSCGDRPFWITDQIGPGPRAGRTWSKHRSMVIVELPGLRLPRILIAGYDTQKVGKWWASMVPIELEVWNRRFGAWCAEGRQRTTHAVLHPRAVEHLMVTLPDGAQLIMGGSTLALWRDERLNATDVAIGLRCLMGLADLLPTFVITENSRPQAVRSAQ